MATGGPWDLTGPQIKGFSTRIIETPRLTIPWQRKCRHKFWLSPEICIKCGVLRILLGDTFYWSQPPGV